MLYYNNVSQNQFIQSVLKEVDKHLSEDHVVRVSEVHDKEHYLLIKDTTTKKKVKLLFKNSVDVEIKVLSKVLNIPENLGKDYRCTAIINSTISCDTGILGKEIGLELNTNSDYMSNLLDGKPSKILYTCNPNKLNETNVVAAIIHSVKFESDHVTMNMEDHSTVSMSYEDLGKLRVSDNTYQGKWYVKNLAGVSCVMAPAKFRAMFTNDMRESHEERIYSN